MPDDVLASPAVVAPVAAPLPTRRRSRVLIGVDLAPGTEAPAQARRVVRDLLARECRPDLVDTACLLTSELVTNAVVHAGAPVELIVDIDDDHISVEVIDPSSAAPRPVEAGPLDTGGRGLAMVATLADAWGTTPIVPGKSVWFSLATS